MNVEVSEEWARNMLLLGIRNGQAAELVTCLWEGGTFTLDIENRKLAFLTKEMMDQARGVSGD